MRASLKHRLEQYRSYNFLRDIKRSIEGLAERYYEKGSRAVTLRPDGMVRGHVLLSCMTNGLTLNPTEQWHIRLWGLA